MVRKVQEVAVVDVEELTACRSGWRARWRRLPPGRSLPVCSLKVFSSAVEEHTRTLSNAAEDALAVGHRRHRDGLRCPQAGAQRLLSMLHLDGQSGEDLRPSGVTAAASGRGVTSVRRRGTAGPPGCDVRPQSARRRAAPRGARVQEGALGAPSSVHSFAVPSRAADERVRPAAPPPRLRPCMPVAPGWCSTCRRAATP